MVKPFSFGDDTPKQRRKKSNNQEKRWAQKADGKTQAGSGAVWSSKGDVKQRRQQDKPTFLFENKRTDSESYRLSTDTWAEIDRKAMLTEGRQPAMHIEIGQQKLRLVVLTEDDFLELTELDK
jgi:hypothetical protein